MNPKTYEALSLMAQRLAQINDDLMKPEVLGDIKRLTQLNKERADLEAKVAKFQEYQVNEQVINDSRKMLEEETDNEMIAYLKQELETALNQKELLIEQAQALLIPKDPNDEKNVIIEIRGAAGGDEANIFAGDLFRMYSRYAENQN